MLPFVYGDCVLYKKKNAQGHWLDTLTREQIIRLKGGYAKATHYTISSFNVKLDSH